MPHWDTDGLARFSYGAEEDIAAHLIVKEGTADGDVGVCDAADKPLGVSPQAIASGDKGPVILAGIALVTMSGAITRGHYVGPAANGKGVSLGATVDNTKHALGKALEAATTDGDVISVLILPYSGPST